MVTGLKGAIDLAIQSVDLPGSSKGHQLNLLLVPGLKADRRACGNVKAEPPGRSTVKGKCIIGLMEMKMAANLHRPVPGIRDHHGDYLQTGVCQNWRGICRNYDFSGFHWIGL